MALQFDPPTALVNAYLSRPSPGQQASEAVNQAFQAYAQQKIQEHKSKNDALGTLLKASDSVDLSDPATAKAFAPLYKDAGVDPTIFQPPTPSTGTTTSPTPAAAPTTPTPIEQATQQSLPSEHPPVPQANAPAPVSPIVQASLAAGHPDHAGIMDSVGDPNQLLKTGYGRKKLAAAESAQRLINAQQADADKAAENGPVPFEYGRGFAKNAGQPNAAEPFIALAQAAGRNTLTKREMTDLKDSINAKSAAERGGAYAGQLNVREQQLRQSLNKDARDVLNPYFQSGTGKDQVARLQSIGRIEPIINQMMAQKNGGNPQQMRELATAFNKVITGSGMGAEGQIDALVPDTGRGRLANLQQFLSNAPQGTQQQAFIHQIADSVAREKAAVTGQIRSQAEANAPTLRLLKENYPEDHQAILDSVMNNPTLVGTPANQSSGPHGPTVTQNGHTYNWNGTNYE